MNEIPISVAIAALFILILLSAVFSSSETAMMAVNRYRIKSLAQNGHRSARLVEKLLASPDRLLGTILFGNNIANIAASALATIIGVQLFGNAGLAYAPFALVFVILVFAEVAPKTLAAIYPERIAFPISYLLIGLQWLLHPFVWLVKTLSNGLLKLFKVTIKAQDSALTSEELHTAVTESGNSLHHSHRDMLLRVLEMEQITVEDIMVQRHEIEAIDLNDEWGEILEKLATSHYTRVPVFQGTLDKFIGIVHIRKLFYLSQTSGLNKEAMIDMIREPYFVPENTSITRALQNLQQQQRRFGVVVDEYGSIKGLITLEQILEKIVGKYTAFTPGINEEILPQDDGSYLIRGAVSLRELNSELNWSLPTNYAKTVNGLILEHLESIPQANTSFKIGDYIFEIIQTRGTSVNLVQAKKAS